MAIISASKVELKRIPEGAIAEGKSVSFPDGMGRDDYLKEDARPGHSYDFSYYEQRDGSVICHDRQHDTIRTSPYTWEQLKEMEKQGVE